jgi:hypothetical protein
VLGINFLQLILHLLNIVSRGFNFLYLVVVGVPLLFFLELVEVWWDDKFAQ